MLATKVSRANGLLNDALGPFGSHVNVMSWMLEKSNLPEICGAS